MLGFGVGTGPDLITYNDSSLGCSASERDAPTFYCLLKIGYVYLIDKLKL